MKRSAFMGGALLLASSMGYFVFSELEMEAKVQAANASDESLVALGEPIYRDHCASCHGAQLEGQPNWKVRKSDGRLPAPPHDESGHTWHHADEVLFRITKEGLSAIVAGYESDMPAYRDLLTDAEIWAVLAYIKSRWPQRIQSIQAGIDRKTKQGRN